MKYIQSTNLGPRAEMDRNTKPSFKLPKSMRRAIDIWIGLNGILLALLPYTGIILGFTALVWDVPGFVNLRWMLLITGVVVGILTIRWAMSVQGIRNYLFGESTPVKR